MPDTMQELLAAINVTGATDLTAENKLKLAIVGVPKTGKSQFALTAPGPIFHADFDDRSESVKEFLVREKRTDIISKSYLDKDINRPQAVNNLEVDLAGIEYAKSIGKPIPATYILDSMTFLRAACERELIKQHSALARNIKLGNNILKIPQGWDIINGNRGYLEYLISRFSSLGHLIAVFHESDEKDTAKSTKEERKYTGRKTIQPQYLSSLLSTFNDVFRITLDWNNKRVVQVHPNSDFLAATSLLLDPEEEPNIQKMLDKHYTKLRAKKP